MREWLESSDPQPGQMIQMVDEVFIKLTAPRTEEERVDRDARPVRWRGNPNEDRVRVREFVTEVVRDLEPVLLEHVIPYRYQPELKFSTTIGVPFLDGRLTGVSLIGGIDIVTCDDADNFHNYDLKATKDATYIDKVLGQAVFYDIAFGHWIGDTSQPRSFGFIFPACKEKLRRVEITDDDRRAMMARIIRMAHGMWRKEWDPKKDDAGCQVCEVRHACDKWKLDIQPDASGRNRVSFMEAANRRRTYSS